MVPTKDTKDALTRTNKPTPEKKIKVGNIHCAVWRNRVGDKMFYSVTCEKRYMKEGKWHSTTNFNKNELPKVVLALQEAYKYLTMEASSESMIEEGKEEYNNIRDTHQRFVEEESVE